MNRPNSLLKTNSMRRPIIIIVLIISLAFILFTWFRNNSEEIEWTSISSQQAPPEVTALIKQQLKEKKYEYIRSLDSSYTSLSVEITNNHWILFSFDYYTLHLNKQLLRIKKEDFFPPYILYNGRLYYSKTRVLDTDASNLDLNFTILK